MPPEAPKLPPQPTVPDTVPPSPSERLYAKSKSLLGTDVTPQDQIPDEVACVDSIQRVVFLALGFFVGSGSAMYNTLSFKRALDAHPRIEKVKDPLPGYIVVCATGEGTNPYEHGHTWIVGNTHWMSNTSFGKNKGLWTANYTKEQVMEDFVRRRGFPLHVYRPL